MLLRLLFKSKKKVTERGLFGYYSLINWWDTKFSEQERVLFKEAYESHSTPIPFECLFSGIEKPFMENETIKKSAVGFLNILLNHLSVVEGTEIISNKFLDKCSQLMYAQTDERDVYFYYLSQVSLYSKIKQRSTLLKKHSTYVCPNQTEALIQH